MEISCQLIHNIVYMYALFTSYQLNRWNPNDAMDEILPSKINEGSIQIWNQHICQNNKRKHQSSVPIHYDNHLNAHFRVKLLAPSLHLFVRKRINYEESVYIYTFYFHIYQRLYLCSVASHGCIEVNMICVYIRKEILLAGFMVSMKFFGSVYKHGVLMVTYKIQGIIIYQYFYLSSVSYNTFNKKNSIQFCIQQDIFDHVKS